jgi:hypothetical protein
MDARIYIAKIRGTEAGEGGRLKDGSNLTATETVQL